MERWLPIDEFYGYSVSDKGRVRNDLTERIMKPQTNQGGVVMIGLIGEDGKQYKRSVAKIVAERFLPHNTNEFFDTPMHLDNDRSNNSVENLVWRPRWYAAKYRQQFESYRPPYINERIKLVGTRRRYKNSWEAAIDNGLREFEVAKSIHEGTVAWPTMQKFERVE